MARAMSRTSLYFPGSVIVVGSQMGMAPSPATSGMAVNKHADIANDGLMRHTPFC
jgi:hypothetical protein